MRVKVFILVLVTLVAATGVGVSFLIGDQSARRAEAIPAVLRQIAEAQAWFRNAALVDQDGDETGEYGFLGELSGAVGVRGGTTEEYMSLTAPSLPPDIGKSYGEPPGTLRYGGYLFRVYLPGPKSPLRESAQKAQMPIAPPSKSVPAAADAQEQHWCCYAWPIERSRTGGTLFFIDESGEVWEKPNVGERAGYFGPRSSPGAGAMSSRSESDAWRRGSPSSNGEAWRRSDLTPR